MNGDYKDVIDEYEIDEPKDLDGTIDKIHNLATTIEESLSEIVELCDDKSFKIIHDECEKILKKFQLRGVINNEIVEIKCMLGWFDAPKVHPVIAGVLHKHLNV